MPKEGVKWKPHENILKFEEITRIIKIMTNLGIQKIRVTGGEPLLRRGISGFLGNLKLITGIEKITLTTNGTLLGNYLNEVDSSNWVLPDGINISLDSLDTGRYRNITLCKTSEPANIILLIDKLLHKNVSVKVNCVPLRNFNEKDILLITALAKKKI
jgi:cyclic pyranopterin phosphate synthase